MAALNCRQKGACGLERLHAPLVCFLPSPALAAARRAGGRGSPAVAHEMRRSSCPLTGPAGFAISSINGRLMLFNNGT